MRPRIDIGMALPDRFDTGMGCSSYLPKIP